MALPYFFHANVSMASPEVATMEGSSNQNLILVAFTGMLVCCMLSVGHILVYNIVHISSTQSWKYYSVKLASCLVVFLSARIWFSFVTGIVPEPYLVS